MEAGGCWTVRDGQDSPPAPSFPPSAGLDYALPSLPAAPSPPVPSSHAQAALSLPQCLLPAGLPLVSIVHTVLPSVGTSSQGRPSVLPSTRHFGFPPPFLRSQARPPGRLSDSAQTGRDTSALRPPCQHRTRSGTCQNALESHVCFCKVLEDNTYTSLSVHRHCMCSECATSPFLTYARTHVCV